MGAGKLCLLPLDAQPPHKLPKYRPRKQLTAANCT